MSIQSRKLALRQLDEVLGRFAPLRDTPRPGRGWLKAIRTALGMSARQLGGRVGVTPATITQIEEREQLATVTMGTMDRMARALDCTFVYALVPNTTLSNMVKDRALALARREVLGSAQSMMLEDQAVADGVTRTHVATLAAEIAATMPRRLWDDDA